MRWNGRQRERERDCRPVTSTDQAGTVILGKGCKTIGRTEIHLKAKWQADVYGRSPAEVQHL